MKVILTENIKGLGQIGETREVKNGYARNFLVPKKLAILATQENLKRVGELKEKKALTEKEEIERMKQVAEKLKELKLILEMPGDEKGNLYAAVNPKKLSEALKEKGIGVDPDYILISEPIKKLGIYSALFKYYDVEAKFEVEAVIERRRKKR
ncbi:MAG: 50S ribosomal protein L9 [Patescibacteria group bacterium]